MKWILLALSALIVLNLTHLFYFNIFTHSLPYGIYMRIGGVPQRGDYAASCLTPEIARYGMVRGYLAEGICSTGSVPVLKIIEGLPGDHFWVKDNFLELNGRSYSIMENDSSLRPLRSFYIRKDAVLLEKDRYMLISDFNKNSWDSRYWGPVGIQFLLKPLWVFEHH